MMHKELRPFIVFLLYVPCKQHMDLVQAIKLIEGFTPCDDEDVIVKAWQFLIDEGHVWRLQGYYGRTAVELIDDGVCKPAKITDERKSHLRRLISDCCAQQTAVKWFLSHADMEVKRVCYGCAEGYRADPFFGELVENKLRFSDSVSCHCSTHISSP